MNDLDALRIALYRMRAAEGQKAVNELIRECAVLAAENGERELVKPLTNLPKVGDMLALEVLAKIGWLVNDNEKKRA